MRRSEVVSTMSDGLRPAFSDRIRLLMVAEGLFPYYLVPLLYDTNYDN
ncbi:MAG: hypothetical protein F6K63_29620 [Moorea sp. SIO1G6]|nr:hypothetical protein [Moorena sp. SIO1G6]NET68328.1 hypothetical protein [Moorena sp. SIO1G6]